MNPFYYMLDRTVYTKNSRALYSRIFGLLTELQIRRVMCWYQPPPTPLWKLWITHWTTVRSWINYHPWSCMVTFRVKHWYQPPTPTIHPTWPKRCSSNDSPVSPQRVLQESCEFGVSVRHMGRTLATVPQSADHIPQCQLVNTNKQV